MVTRRPPTTTKPTRGTDREGGRSGRKAEEAPSTPAHDDGSLSDVDLGDPINPAQILRDIKGDDHQAALKAMRDKLAFDFVVAPTTVVAQIASRLQDVLREIHGDAASTPAAPVPGSPGATITSLKEKRARRSAS